MPCFRHTSLTARPASASFRIETICASVNRDFFISASSANHARGLYYCAVYLLGELTSLADAIGINVSQLKRYEGGTSQPTLEVLRKLSIALSVSADALIFDESERGPDEELKLLFEGVKRLTPEEKHLVKELIEGVILKHEARRWTGTCGGDQVATK